MASAAVVINGMPGAGKTTLAAELAPALGIPLLSKDAIKEALADLVDVRLPTSAIGAIAAETLWRMVALIDGPVIVESFWLSGRDDVYFEQGLAVAGVERGVEVWCEAPLEVVRQRFRTRPRHPVHTDAGRVAELDASFATARPISRFPVLRVDTVEPVDVAALAGRIRAVLPELPALPVAGE